MNNVNPYVLLVLEHLIPLVGSLLMLLVAPLVAWVAAYAKRKWNIQIDSVKQAKLEDTLDHAILHAEEWGNGKVSAAVGDPTKLPTGEQKMEQAISFAESELKRRGLDQMAKEEIQAWINARLAVARTDDDHPVAQADAPAPKAV
jgi:hypothetical protein